MVKFLNEFRGDNLSKSFIGETYLHLNPWV